MGITADLTDKIVATTYETLTPEAITAARRLLLDGISIAIAGTEEEAIQILASHYESFGARGDATVIGFPFRTAPTLAAALNGASMHVLDFEPMWTPSNHALSTTLPAILALADIREISGEDIITALVKGIELQGWIRHAGRVYEHGGVKFHPPGLVGPMGSAVAAGHILGLTAGQMAHALGIASSRCGTLHANIGTMTKSTHCGMAAMHGLELALLASKGFTANPEPFEAHNGYARQMFGDTFEVKDLLNFGPPFRIVQPGYAMKMFPSQFGTHFAITAGMTLHAQIPDPSADRIDQADHASDAVREPAASRYRPRGQIQPAIHVRERSAARRRKDRHLHRSRGRPPGHASSAQQDRHRHVPRHPRALRQNVGRSLGIDARWHRSAHPLRRPTRHLGFPADQRRRSPCESPRLPVPPPAG